MFRNQASTPSSGALLGRPPTPPHTSAPTPRQLQSQVQTSPYFGTKSSPNAMGTSLVAGKVTREISRPTSRKPPLSTSINKGKSNKGNSSILSFFGKADSTVSKDNDKIGNDFFFQDRSSRSNSAVEPFCRRSPSPSAALFEDTEVVQSDGALRFNEIDAQSKRRKLSSDDPENKVNITANGCTSPPPEAQSSVIESDVSNSTLEPPSEACSKRQQVSSRIGGFIEDSDSEDELQSTQDGKDVDLARTPPKGSGLTDKDVLGTEEADTNLTRTPSVALTTLQEDGEPYKKPSPDEANSGDNDCPDPTLSLSQRESTDTFEANIDEFAGLQDFENEEFFEEGEEYMERKFMEEQQLLEMDFEHDDGQTRPTKVEESATSDLSGQTDNVQNCPICNTSLNGITESEVSAHVNGCLDGKPIPISSKKLERESPVKPTPNAPASAAKRFQRSAIARPAQENPYSLSPNGQPKSAFSQLMSGHAEDAAWAAAAANEVNSRGKPAYVRTCPFYKIMPGMFICVDAFRYGAVEGQRAYFLSHFHSDHYVGLTSSWCHGPIYCSKVTGNLVRQSLRVDPKWVVDLEFEKRVEVPGTEGVHVTMIPANHCPGSSLFLFEKPLFKGPNPKLKRILHCGDFRACPAHVNHPLLRPNVQDSITGKIKDQIIDTCYLDTTYLTPKYAFPSQEDVINACAQMCVSLSKEIVDSGDKWEQAKRERAGSGMVKFLDKAPSTDNTPPIKTEEQEEDVKPKKRGRLLVVIGTYSIGKERICLGIARALNSKIYAPPSKQRVCACLEDPELSARLTSNPLEAQVHMQMLMEIRAETLAEYLSSFRNSNGQGHLSSSSSSSSSSAAPFSRIVGFRPTGWNYRPPTSRFTENPAVSTVLHSEGWKSRFTMKDLVPQRGSTRESKCFGVPYSEHSSFRELTMFVCALRIGKVVPTVNVGSARGRERMKGWVEKWEGWRRREGLFEWTVEGGAGIE